MSRFKDVAGNYSLKYEVLVYVKLAGTWRLYGRGDVGVKAYTAPYPVFSSTTNSGAGSSGAVEGRLLDVSPIKREMPQAKPDGATSFIRTSECTIKISDADNTLVSPSTASQTSFKNDLVYVWLVPEGDGTTREQGMMLWAGMVESWSKDKGVLTLDCTDFQESFFSGFSNASYLTKSKFPYAEDSYFGKFIPIIYGEIDSSQTNNKGAVELIPVNEEHPDRAVKNRQYVVAAHDVASVPRIYEYSTKDSQYTEISADVASQAYDAAKGAYIITFTNGRGLGATEDDDYQVTLTADVFGKTNTAGRMLEEPIEVLTDMITSYADGTGYLGAALGAMFYDTKAGIQDVFRKARMKAAGVITEEDDLSATLKRFCQEFNLRMYAGHTQDLYSLALDLELLAIPTNKVHDYEFDRDDVTWTVTAQHDILKGKFSVKAGGRKYVNRIPYKYARNYTRQGDSEMWLGGGVVQSDVSIALFGTEESKLREFKWIRDSRTAQNCTQVQLYRWSFPYPTLKLTATLGHSWRELSRVAKVSHFFYGEDRRAMLESIEVDPMRGTVKMEFLDVEGLWDDRYYLVADSYTDTYGSATAAEKQKCGYLCDNADDEFTGGDAGKRLWPLGGSAIS